MQPFVLLYGEKTKKNIFGHKINIEIYYNIHLIICKKHDNINL